MKTKTRKRKIHTPVLINAAAMSRQHPTSFYYPSKKDLAGIEAGNWVKVCDGAERFWAEVVSRDGDIIVARVDSAIGFGGQDYGYDDLIQFGTENIYDILDRSAAPHV